MICTENMFAGLKIAPNNDVAAVPVGGAAVMPTMNESVFVSGSPALHTTQTTASLRQLSARLDA